MAGVVQTQRARKDQLCCFLDLGIGSHFVAREHVQLEVSAQKLVGGELAAVPVNFVAEVGNSAEAEAAAEDVAVDVVVVLVEVLAA